MKLNIKYLRRSLNLTQGELAAKIGMSVQNLHRLETNNKRGAKSVMISGDHADRFCEVLQCSILDLVIVEKVKDRF